MMVTTQGGGGTEWLRTRTQWHAEGGVKWFYVFAANDGNGVRFFHHFSSFSIFSSFLHHFLLCFELQGGGKATLTLQGPGLTIDGEVRVLAAFSELSTKQEFTPGFCILNGNSRRSSYRERERESTNDRWRW